MICYVYGKVTGVRVCYFHGLDAASLLPVSSRKRLRHQDLRFTSEPLRMGNHGQRQLVFHENHSLQMQVLELVAHSGKKSDDKSKLSLKQFGINQ